MQELKDRVAVVTGASRGIGAGLVRAFLARGLRVAACARSAPDADQIPGEAPGLFFERADVAVAEDVGNFARTARERLGPLDLWVNNAGILEPMGMVRNLEPEAFARHMAVNLSGVLNGTRAFLGLCHKEGRGGTLINVGSGASTSPYEGWGAYCAGKAAVDMLTRVTALEEARHGVRVFALAPGIIETGMQVRIREQAESAFPSVQKFRDLASRGLLLSPESPASAILRLAFGEALPEGDVLLDVRKSPQLADLGTFA